MDYYDLLGVKRSASADELKTAYKRQAMKNHPDKGGDPEKFKQINEAYQALSDPQQKKMYDQFGTTDPQQMKAQNNYHFRSNNFDFEDIFSNFGFGQNFARRSPKNKDFKMSYVIDIKDVYTGKTDTITYQLPNGKIEVLDVHIPPGIHHGANVRFAGYGDNSNPTLPRGDLIISILIKNDNKKYFKREGNNIHIKTDVNILDLIIGATINVKTPENKNINLIIPKGTKPNTIFNITGHGVPDLHTKRRGNLQIEVCCLMPLLSEEQLEELRKLRSNLKRT